MTVQDDAVAAAQQAYPQGITAEGEREIRRVPYAQGYQAGHAKGVQGGRSDVLDYIRQLGHGDLANLAEVQLRTRDSFVIGGRWCSQCDGPYTTEQGGDPQYAGHWDTCPNRWQAKRIRDAIEDGADRE